MVAHAALSDQLAPDDSLVISEPPHIELRFDRTPLHLERWITGESSLRSGRTSAVRGSGSRNYRAEQDARALKRRVAFDHSAAAEAIDQKNHCFVESFACNDAIECGAEKSFNIESAKV